MANFPGPYEIEYRLTGFSAPTREHVMRFNVAASGTPAIGANPNTIDIQKKGGATAKLDVVASALWDYIRLAYAATVVCAGYQFWRYTTGTYAKTFIATGAVTTPAGATGSINVAQETILTFRSANGGIAKIALLEPNISGNSKTALVPNAAGTAVQKIAAYVLSADSPVMARDDAFLINALVDARGENESIWRLVYR